MSPPYNIIHFTGIVQQVMLEVTLLSLLCSSKKDVSFRITIKLVIDHY
jgi:hypothetical protein